MISLRYIQTEKKYQILFGDITVAEGLEQYADPNGSQFKLGEDVSQLGEEISQENPPKNL